MNKQTAVMSAVTPPVAGKPEQVEQFFLPSFCDVRLVFAVVVITELLAFVLALVSPGILDNPWENLGLLSMFMQWIALTSAAVLCVARRYLARLGNTAAGILSYLLVLLVTAAVSEMAFWLMVSSQAFTAINSGQHLQFLLRSLIISTVIAAVVLRYLFVQHQWRVQLQAETRSRIQALQARIRPHFLFNSMNTIAALTRSRPETAEEAIQDLADLFRASLNNTHERTTLAEELTLARRYLNIEALRLGDRLQVEWDMDNVPPDTRVPPLILQPLLENTIYHGIEPLPGGGLIRVAGTMEQGMVDITITNPVPAQGGGSHEGNRIALDNIRQRLGLAFGPRAGLETEGTGNEYRVNIHFPEAQTS
ncbi:MAG: sensor histidine kinase [Thiohalobacterales bacterium]|nr:sensor histidine kinase [Thiohalobacterales bacterium]